MRPGSYYWQITLRYEIGDSFVHPELYKDRDVANRIAGKYLKDNANLVRASVTKKWIEDQR